MYQFKEGDKVRVVKECEGNSVCHYGKKWQNIWHKDMNVYIYSKEIGVVSQVSSFGITVDFKDDFWNFPSEALELVEDTTIEQEIIKAGDIIECISDTGWRWWTIGKHYKVVKTDRNGNIIVLDNDEDEMTVNLEYFKLVSKAGVTEEQKAPVLEDTLESLITECSTYFNEVSVYIDKPEDKIEYTLQIDGYKFVGTKEYVVSKMKGAIEWMKS